MNDDHRAYRYICPNCNAQPGMKCTEATDTGRKPVTYIHHTRVNLIDNK